MNGAGVVLVVCPHLLVSQAAAVALGSVGTAAQALPWQVSVLGRGSVEPGSWVPRRLVVILDRTDDQERVAEVLQLVQTNDVRVLLVTSFEVATWWGELLQEDCVDLAVDVTSVAQLATAVDEFVAGRVLLGPDARSQVREAWLHDLKRRDRVESLLRTLSPQQTRVLDLLATGRGVAEVGEALGVTGGTVRSHVKSLRAKLGARSQLEAVAMLRSAHDVGTSGRVPRPRRVSGGSGAEVRR